MTDLRIRQEEPADIPAIGAVTTESFRQSAHGDQGEAHIIDALRKAGALTLSLVAVRECRIVGHAAFSPVRIGGRPDGWFGLGPIAVHPRAQRRGIGAMLVGEGLARLQARGAHGCVVLGDPAYYNRLGFHARSGLYYAGVPEEYLMALPFGSEIPSGEVRYHHAFTNPTGATG